MNNLINIRFAFENSTYSISSSPDDTILTLKSQIKAEIENKEGKTFSTDDMSIKLGFPPTTIKSDKDNSTLKEMKISNNESLRVEITNLREFTNKINSGEEISQPINSNISANDPIDYSNYSVYRKVIAADNSCLFNAINYAINQSINEPQTMRELIGVEIQSNPDFYNEAILEKDPYDYCSWIMRNDTWGGGIELSILTKCFQIKFGIADVKNCNIQYFGEDFPEIIYLLYDGLHYDVFVSNKKTDNEKGVFSSADEKVKNDVLEITKQLNKLNKFTDTKNYSIKCNVCYQLFKGNEEAVAHSKSSGHVNFVQL